MLTVAKMVKLNSRTNRV